MDTANPADDRFTAESYFHLVDEGVIGPDDRVELLDGVIVGVSPSGPRHASVIARISRVLMWGTARALVVVRTQLPIVVSRYSAPEPDIALVAGADDDYLKVHPTTALLVVEVSDSSLPQDRITKARVYAGGNIPEYWIVNLRDECIEVLTEPDAAHRIYRKRRTAHRGDTLEILQIPAVRIAVADLLPAADTSEE